MEVENEPKKEKSYGRAGCLIAVAILVIIIILIVTGLINIPEMT
ncbi:hypothetical protein [Salinimicrobium marinum]|nr:hypothetical protein [Salinimicrobium marinum]